MLELVDDSIPVERIATGYVFTEGPVWDHRNGRLIFSDNESDSIYQWRRGEEAALFRRPSGGGNGNTIDRQRRLITCEAVARRVTRTEGDGSLTVLASEYEGRRLNGVNDVVCGPDDSIYFTDTFYGPPRGPDGRLIDPGVPFYGVYRIAPDGGLSLLTDEFDPPNGIALSSDGRQLFVDDTRHHLINVFDLNPDGSVANGRLFADTRHDEVVGRPDGIKLDVLGNLYLAANTEEGVWVYSPQGQLLGFIEVPEPPANLAWGEDDWQTLFVTAKTSVYRVRMKVAGQPVGVS